MYRGGGGPLIHLWFGKNQKKYTNLVFLKSWFIEVGKLLRHQNHSYIFVFWVIVLLQQIEQAAKKHPQSLLIDCLLKLDWGLNLSLKTNVEDRRGDPKSKRPQKILLGWCFSFWKQKGERGIFKRDLRKQRDLRNSMHCGLCSLLF